MFLPNLSRYQDSLNYKLARSLNLHDWRTCIGQTGIGELALGERS